MVGLATCFPSGDSTLGSEGMLASDGNCGNEELAVIAFCDGSDGMVSMLPYCALGKLGRLGKEDAGVCAKALAHTPAINNRAKLRFFN